MNFEGYLSNIDEVKLQEVETVTSTVEGTSVEGSENLEFSLKTDKTINKDVVFSTLVLPHVLYYDDDILLLFEAIITLVESQKDRIPKTYKDMIDICRRVLEKYNK